MNKQLFKEFITKTLFVEGVGTSNLSTKHLDEIWNNFNHDDYREDNEYDSYDEGPGLTLDDKMIDVQHLVSKFVQSKGGKLFGAGSSRETYILTSKLILKLAINQKGLEQNKTEAEFNKKFPNITAKVYKVGPESYYIVSELVRPLKSPDEVEKLSGIADWSVFRKIFKVLGDYNELNMPVREIAMYAGLSEQSVEQCLAQPFVQLLLDMCDQGMAINDFPRFEHYGKTADNRVVLLDYGLSLNTWENLYNNND